MIRQKNSWYWPKLNGALRYALMHTATRAFPLYVVNEYPKSGASWIGELLSDAMGIPFPRNRLPMLRSCIMHGHMMHSWNMHNVLIVWRDGRDVLVSQYYHYLFRNEKGNARLVKRCRADLQFLNYDDITTNLPAFIEYVYDKKKHPKFTWSDFVERWSGCKDCVNTKYEDMRQKPETELIRIVNQLTGKTLDRQFASEIVVKHSFEKQSGRSAGEENPHSFMRKGIVGDWKNHFNQAAKERFHFYAGDALIKLGYENDDLWVK